MVKLTLHNCFITVYNCFINVTVKTFWFCFMNKNVFFCFTDIVFLKAVACQVLQYYPLWGVLSLRCTSKDLTVLNGLLLGANSLLNIPDATSYKI